MNKKYYLTAAIPYVNASPHLGHALEFVQCDVIARHHRLLGEETVLLTGADENSLKNVQAAEKEGVSIKKLCDKNAKIFKKLIKKLNTRFDIFQRSSSKNHFQGSQKLWQLCDKSGDIYKKKYKGLYCVGCETFYTKDDLTPDGYCLEHLAKAQEIEEENYFFRLSKYQALLDKLISSDKLKIFPPERKNEVLSFIRSGLEDFSISRSKKRAKNWGVPVPKDPRQIMYVWFDALNVYQTGIGFCWKENLYKKFWPADIHVIGKGIIRFHAVYWPAILMSAKLALPKSIFVHGYLTIEGQKMSKTIGNIINPFILIDKYGTDPLRYYLLREIPSFADGDFSQHRFKELYNADLANNLGNLISRVAKLASKINFRRKKLNSESYNQLISRKKYQFYLVKFESFRFHECLDYLFKQLTSINKEIDQKKPWNLKENKLINTLLPIIIKILEIAVLLEPFLPQTSERIRSQFSRSEIIPEKPLFPRIN